MKLLSSLLISSSLFAADYIVDLGTLTSRKGVTLSHNISDFDHYRLELLDGTNKINLNITNNLIKLRDLGQISIYESNNFGWVNSQTHTNYGAPPLPNGSPETYPEYVEKMLRFYSDMHMRMNNGRTNN